jgi:dinuclear metal center YbgI/SA1388 family protein
MTATVADIIKVMETVAPLRLAEEWDNVGLQVGQLDWPVRSIWVALDPLYDVVDGACRNGVNLLITHHPLIFNPLRCINFKTPVGAVIQAAAGHKLAIFAAHTNFDSAADGINDALAFRIGLADLEVLKRGDHPDEDSAAEFYPLLTPATDYMQKQGLGRVGELEETMELLPLALSIKKKLGLKNIKIAGKPDLPVRRVAVCSGSGSGLMKDFFSSGAQVFISGDLRYHDAREVEALNLGLIDMGHFASEYLAIEILAKRLDKILAADGKDVKVEACRLENDPFLVL